jgi:hypothetical protein
MRAFRSGLILLAFSLLAAHSSWAGEVPDPLFWPSEKAFLDQVSDGQFDPHLELHLLQYSADPRWAAEWAALRYAGNGLFGEYGSTTSNELYVNSQIAVNLFPTERFQVRYDRRDYQDGRFDVSDQRLDLMWYPAKGWAVFVTGWPTHLKEEASGGLGFRIGAQKSRNSLEVSVVNDRLVWNDKTQGDVTFSRSPVRILLDGYYESGPWRLHGSVDYGLAYEAATAATAAKADSADSADGASGSSTRGFQRFGNLSIEHSSPTWSFGARLTGATLERSQETGTTGNCSLSRSWSRAVLYARRDLGRWSVSGLIGYAEQRDDFSSPSVHSGSYRMDTALLGVEGAYRVVRGLEVRVGYLGSALTADRSVAAPGPLPDQEESIWVDKAHLRAIYEFGPRMSIEMLVSQTVNGSSFGGGSIKALFVF